MANKVEIEVNADSRPAEEGFKGVNQSMEKVKTQTTSMTQGFNGFNRVMGIVGLSSLGAVFGLRKFADIQETVKATSAASEAQLASFGPSFVSSLDEVRGSLADAAADFGFTGTEAERAFVTIATTAQDANVGIDDVKFAMALARNQSISLGEAANVTGNYLLGNATAFEALGFRASSYSEDAQSVIEKTEGTVGPLTRMASGLKTLGEQLTSTSGLQQLLGDIVDDVGDSFKTFGAAVVEESKAIGSTVAGLGTTINDALLDISAAFASAIADLSKDIVVKIKGVLDPLEPGSIAAFLADLENDLKAGIGTVLNMPVDIALFLVNVGKELVSTITTVLGFPGGGAIALFLRSLGDVLVTPIKTVLDPPSASDTLTFLSKIRDALVTTLTVILEPPGPGAIAAFISDLGKKLADAIKNAGGGIWDFIQWMFDFGPNLPGPLSHGSSGGAMLAPAGAGGGSMAMGVGATVVVNMNFTGDLVVDNEGRERDMARRIKELLEEDIRRGGAF